MPPDYPAPYLSNEDLLEVIKNAPLEYDKKVKDMRQLKEDMQKYVSSPYLTYIKGPTYKNTHQQDMSTWDKQFSEQNAYKVIEERLLKRMEMEIRKVEEMHAYQMASLGREMAEHQAAVEELITALVAQNRELSRRVTDLEWDGTTP